MAETRWHYTQNGARQTPVTESQLRKLAADGRLRPSDMVWREGMPQWGPAANVTGLFAGVAPPPLPTALTNYYGQASGYPPAAADIGQDPRIRMLLPVGRSGWAIAAGYLGLFSLLILPAPLSLIISIIAIRDIRKHPDRHGMGRAIFGLVMGIPGTLLIIFMLISVATGHR